jgi:hypothetical protein
MHHRRKNLTVCSLVCAKLVSHELPRHLALMFQCLAKEAFGSLTVSMFSDQNIDDVPILIHCPPQIVALASDGDKYFINVSDIPEPSLFPAQRSSIGRSKLDAPVSDRLIGDGDTSLRKQILHIAKAECEPMIEPDGMADNFRGEPMTLISRFHPFIVAQFSLT